MHFFEILTRTLNKYWWYNVYRWNWNKSANVHLLNSLTIQLYIVLVFFQFNDQNFDDFPFTKATGPFNRTENSDPIVGFSLLNKSLWLYGRSDG